MPDFNQQVQTWHSGDNTCLPMLCGFDTRLAVTCTLSLLVLYSAPRSFSPGTPVFPFLQKPTIIDLNCFTLILLLISVDSIPN